MQELKDDWTIWVIRKLNYLDVTRIFSRSHVLWKKTLITSYLISEWTLDLVNALNYYWCETSYNLKLFWSARCPEISFSRILYVGPVLYPEVFYGIVEYLIFSTSFYITFKKKILACESQVGHIRIALLVSGSTSVTHFQPWFVLKNVLKYTIVLKHKPSTSVYYTQALNCLPYVCYHVD